MKVSLSRTLDASFKNSFKSMYVYKRVKGPPEWTGLLVESHGTVWSLFLQTANAYCICNRQRLNSYNISSLKESVRAEAPTLSNSHFILDMATSNPIPPDLSHVRKSEVKQRVDVFREVQGKVKFLAAITHFFCQNRFHPALQVQTFGDHVPRVQREKNRHLHSYFILG